MLYQIDFVAAVGVPEVDGEDVERSVNFTSTSKSAIRQPGNIVGRRPILDINLLFGLSISHDESNARRWGDRSSVLE